MDAKQMMSKIGIADPRQAYEWLLKRRLFLNAAQMAKEHGFEKDEVAKPAIEAYRMMCRFGELKAAADIAIRFKLDSVSRQGLATA